MKRLAISLLFVWAVIACESNAPSASPSPADFNILIGSDLPMTGFGGGTPPWQQAIQLAVDQHPKIGRFTLGYRSMDNALAGAPSPDKGIQNLDQLIDDHRVLGVIGPGASYVALAEIPAANQAPLVMISNANTRACLTRSQPACRSQADVLRPSGRNNFFRIAPPDPLQGAAMAGYLVNDLHLRRAAAINENGDTGSLYVDSFSAQLARLGGELVLSKDLASGTTDFSQFMADAKAKGAQAVYAVGTADDQICVAASQLPAGMVFIGPDTFANDSQCVTQAGPGANGIFGTSSDVDATQLPSASPVVNLYRKRFPRTDASTGYTFAAYDCAQILIEAIQHAMDANGGEIPSRAQVLDAVARTDAYQGVTGTYSFDANGDAKVPLMSVYEVKNGQWTFMKRLDVIGG